MSLSDVRKIGGGLTPGITTALVDAGVNINATDNDGFTALDLAIRSYNWQAKQTLEENGAERGSR